MKTMLMARIRRWRDRQRAWQQQREWFARTFRADLYLATRDYWDRRSHINAENHRR
jgi:hypothetical protein